MPPLRRRQLLALAAGPVLAHAQTAVPAEVAAELPQARLSGSGRLRYFGLSVYDARLWVSEGFEAARFEQHPLALELIYARALVGRLIAERSLKEMKGIGPVPDEAGQRWLAWMTQTFPDVRDGDRITGVYRPDGLARFFLNAKPLGDQNEAAFARLFFGIWLSPRSSEPALRQSLLGGRSGP